MASGPNHQQRRAGAGPERAQALRRAFRDQHEVPAGMARRPPPCRPRWRTRHGGIGGKRHLTFHNPPPGWKATRGARELGGRLGFGGLLPARRSPERVPHAAHFRTHVRPVEVVGAPAAAAGVSTGRFIRGAAIDPALARPNAFLAVAVAAARALRRHVDRVRPRGRPDRPARPWCGARAADTPPGQYARGNAACTLPARRLRRRACSDPLPPRVQVGPPLRRRGRWPGGCPRRKVPDHRPGAASLAGNGPVLQADGTRGTRAGCMSLGLIVNPIGLQPATPGERHGIPPGPRASDGARLRHRR